MAEVHWNRHDDPFELTSLARLLDLGMPKKEVEDQIDVPKWSSAGALMWLYL